ncbi:MAG: twin-arginine translocase subunit TatC [Candidatus Levybacteria bacterium]|nr:twin-arginine translocase subunit TatC [Candidatus Levybacteria bacterium]
MATSAKPSTTIELDNSMAKYMPFLVEIRKRLFFTLAIFLIASILGFIFYEKTTRLILPIFSIEGLNIVFTSPFQFVSLAINSGLLIGFIAVLPLLIIQLLAFLKPALSSKEYKTVILLLPISIFLFIGGFSFGAFIMKFMVALFYEKSLGLNIGNILDINRLLTSILLTATLMGIAFQFPIVLTILMRLKVVKYKSLVKQRLWAHVSVLLFAIILPPTDLLSLVLLFLPLAFLFEFTLLLNRILLKSHLL